MRSMRSEIVVFALALSACRAGFEVADDAGSGDAANDGGLGSSVADAPGGPITDDGGGMSGDDGGEVIGIDGGTTVDDGGSIDAGGADGGADGGPDGGTPPPPPRVLSAGCEHTCAVRPSGAIFCWGRNDHGQLGNDSTTDSATPVAVTGITRAVAVAAGCGHTCAVLDSGAVRCWGRNDMGQLGVGTLTDSHTPVDVPGLAGAVELGAGYHTCARFPDGSLRCQGWNLYGQCGDGTRTTRRMAVDVVEGCCALGESRALATGLYQNCSLTSAGSVLCWGGNDQGEIGDGTTTARTTPVPVTGVSSASAIGGGRFLTCAVIADGSARCWGGNSSGQTGNGVRTTREGSPMTVIGLGGPAIEISPGGLHACALLDDGSVQCWGGNSFGELGIDEPSRTYSTTTPVTVPGLSSVAMLTSKADHTCALLADGSIRCWGANTYGQIGDGTTEDAFTPVAVVSLP